MAQSSWSINELEYLECPSVSVMAYHDFYPEGHQGGVTIVHHGRRVAACGDLHVTLADGRRAWRGKPGERRIDRDRLEIATPVTKAEAEIGYTVRIRAEGESVRVIVDLDEPLDPQTVKAARFTMELYPPGLFGLTWHLDGESGVFPREPVRPMGSPHGTRPMATGRRLVIAPECPERRMVIESAAGELSLVDPRKGHEEGWFQVAGDVSMGVARGALEWLITPHRIPGWRRPPVICVSQIGYRPDQPKRALIEHYPVWDESAYVTLLRVEADHGPAAVLTSRPEPCGKFLRYEYGVFDFTEVRAPGVYMLQCGDQTTGPFRIAEDVFAHGVWQPTLASFFPVQMCHAEVWDGGRCWHGACHLDDALQAPAPHQHFDGYAQGETTDTPFEPYQHIAHLDRGGWHDAGDTDLAAGSQAWTTHVLALAHEEFGIDLDETTVSEDSREVLMHQPDGVPDVIQQIAWGVECLLGGYRTVGHSFCGIIAGNRRHYYQRGSLSTMTDNLVYDASLAEDERTGDRAGLNDDRWAFTNRDTGLEYKVAAALAAAGRMLRGHDDALADECLKTAAKAWQYEQEHEPVRHRSAYVPGDRETQEVLATVELLLSTGEVAYADRLKAVAPALEDGAAHAVWAAARAIEAVGDEEFARAVRDAAEAHAAGLGERLAGNPFRLPWGPHIWGEGWKLQDFAVRHYYLLRAFPDLFGPDPILDTVNWVLGCHPGSNVSFVSGVGPRSLTIAFGINRSEWSYIAGGMASGTALIRPDLPELLDDIPFLWQQTEYVMPGAATYIFCVLAAQALAAPAG
jgi:endoglucanase